MIKWDLLFAIVALVWGGAASIADSSPVAPVAPLVTTAAATAVPAPGRLIRTFEQYAVTGVAFAPDGKTMVTGGFDSTELWDLSGLVGKTPG